MKSSRLWLAAAIIAFAVLGSFVLSVPHTREATVDTQPSQRTPTDVPSVSIKDSFKQGVHTITGSFEAPNACAAVDAQASYAADGGSDTDGSILVALFLPKDFGICLQLPTRIHFSATVAAPANLPITVTVNGVTATTTL